MHGYSTVRVWFAGVVLLAGLAGGGSWAVAQSPAAQSPAIQSTAAQSTTMQMRPAAPLTQDFDPVPSPDVTTAPSKTVLPAPTAQTGEITKENGRFTLRTEASEVRLNVSVVDSAGHPVDTLPESAFHVYEDGVEQKIVGFSHEDLPISLGILIDSSGSMYDKRAAVDAAALNLVKLSNPQDEAFLVDFSSEPYIDQDFTSSIAKLQQGLAYIKAGGGTALYDAVIASADYLVKHAKRSKQVLLIVTDGDDNASNATLQEAIRRVQDLDGPSIYCIGLLFGEDVSRREAKHSRQVLTELSDQTGGKAYFPKALKDVDGIAHEVAQDIRTQYMIEYHSSAPSSQGGYRHIHVEVSAKGFHGLEARTRTGYFPKHVDASPAPVQSRAPGGN